MRPSADGDPRHVAVRLARARARTCSPRAREHVTRLVVEVGNRAGAWRNAAVDAQRAFECWKQAGPVDRGMAAAGYLAAIEREEKAASEYSRAVEACSRMVL